jgi:hypothetical protein
MRGYHGSTASTYDAFVGWTVVYCTAQAAMLKAWHT